MVESSLDVIDGLNLDKHYQCPHSSYAPLDCPSAFPKIYMCSTTEVVYALNEHKRKVHMMILDDVDAETLTEIRKTARVLGVSMPCE